MKRLLKIFTDGGSRGNPGESAIGVVMYDQDEKMVWERGQAIGVGTNNEAEYKALDLACDWLLECKAGNWEACQVDEVYFYLDSKLVVEQMQGNWKVKEERLRKLRAEIKEKLDKINLKCFFQHIPREENKRADELVNQALDLKLL